MFYKIIMEKNEDKLFYIDLNDNEKNFSNNKIYNSIFQDDFIAVINSNIYIITIRNGELKQKKFELNNKDEIISISFSKNKLYNITKSQILYLEDEKELNLDNLELNKINILEGILSRKQIKKISCSIDETLFLTSGGMVYYQKQGENNQKLIIELLEYSTEEIYSGENFHMVKCKKRSDDKNINP